MSMIRHRFLSIAITLSLLIICDPIYLKLIVIILSSIYHWRFMHKYTLLLCLFYLCFFWWSNVDDSLMKEHILKVDEIRDNYVFASNGSRKCILYHINDVSLYDVIHVEGAFSKPLSAMNKNTFQFGNYLKHHHVYSSMYVEHYQFITKSNHIKTKLYEYIKNIEDKKVKAYLQKLFYHIGENQQDNDYLIYASGMHISFLAALFAKIGKLNYHKTAIAVSFAFMMLFPIAAYMLRVFIFSLTVLLFHDFHQREQLGISIIALYWIDPMIIYEISFLIPVLFRFVFVFNITKVSSKLIQLFVLIPFQLFNFQECNLLSIILFPLLRSINGIAYLLSVITLLNRQMYPLLHLYIEIQSQLLKLLSTSYTLIGKPFMIWMLMWVILIYLYITYCKQKHLIGFLILFILHIHMKILTPYGEVSFIDVGQGDCILIREPLNGEVMLIDVAGKIGKNIPASTIYPFLKAKGIRYIDKVVLTHDDYDHSGGLKDLKKLIPIKEVIDQKKDIHLKYLHFNAYQFTHADNENDKSIVLFAHINHLNYLFCGDASKQVEKNIIDQFNMLEADIVKIGHHGSKSSSSQDFIHQLHPLLSVISSGRNNRYHHPHEEVLNILEKENSMILNTQNNGSISIYFHPLFNFLITGDNSFSYLR